MELKVKKIHAGARLPSYGHEGDAGLDLYSDAEIILEPGIVHPVSTGIRIAVPAGYVGLVWDKSGISLAGIHRLAGVIDSGYRGEVKVVLINLGSRKFVIEKGMKIAQLLIQPVEKAVVIESRDLDDSARGANGFGSTGKF